jgi:hypothetical protein
MPLLLAVAPPVPIVPLLLAVAPPPPVAPLLVEVPPEPELVDEPAPVPVQAASMRETVRAKAGVIPVSMVKRMAAAKAGSEPRASPGDPAWRARGVTKIGTAAPRP